jgi:hypothetical protein
MSLWSMVFRKPQRERVRRLSWRRGPKWMISHPKDHPSFLRALPTLFPDSAVLYLENVHPAEDLERFLEAHAAENPRLIPSGELFQRPEGDCVPISRANMDELARLLEELGDRDIAQHLHVYSGEVVLLMWYDARWPDGPIFVSKDVPEVRLDAFCKELGVSREAA